MVDQVKAVLDVESARKPDEVGCSVRRNPFNISPSSFHKIAKKKLGLHAYKLRKNQKLRIGNRARRLAFCGQTCACFKGKTRSQSSGFTS